jgi:hypothetical protein
MDELKTRNGMSWFATEMKWDMKVRSYLDVYYRPVVALLRSEVPFDYEHLGDVVFLWDPNTTLAVATPRSVALRYHSPPVGDSEIALFGEKPRDECYLYSSVGGEVTSLHSVDSGVSTSESDLQESVDSVGAQSVVDGYCYLLSIKPEDREQIQAVLGPYPTVDRLVHLQAACSVDLSTVFASVEPGGSVHVSRTGRLSLLSLLQGALLGHQCEKPGTLCAVIRAVEYSGGTGVVSLRTRIGGSKRSVGLSLEDEVERMVITAEKLVAVDRPCEVRSMVLQNYALALVFSKGVLRGFLPLGSLEVDYVKRVLQSVVVSVGGSRLVCFDSGGLAAPTFGFCELVPDALSLMTVAKATLAQRTAHTAAVNLLTQVESVSRVAGGRLGALTLVARLGLGAVGHPLSVWLSLHPWAFSQEFNVSELLGDTIQLFHDCALHVSNRSVLSTVCENTVFVFPFGQVSNEMVDFCRLRSVKVLCLYNDGTFVSLLD